MRCRYGCSSVTPGNPAIHGGEERSAANRRHSRVRITGMVLVYRYRVKSLNGLLNRQSRAVKTTSGTSATTRRSMRSGGAGSGRLALT
ncbi:hypothetical protein BN2475_10040 [Paraburkholderia ribeironis]|uniref:Uncharacterized protein n=1 Tax=Paraburkholderia ribeironis TaxID=1247936 RepID=A0A1N7RIL2_9BURK|nr:hypothetical protein BN2475_10040 [Paraburkholderia ribeironis]